VLPPRPASLQGLTVGLLANGKANSDRLLHRVADELRARHRLADVIVVTKPHPSLPVDDAVLTMFAEHAHAVVTAIGD
jgi:hypothetical protein